MSMSDCLNSLPIILEIDNCKGLEMVQLKIVYLLSWKSITEKD